MPSNRKPNRSKEEIALDKKNKEIVNMHIEYIDSSRQTNNKKNIMPVFVEKLNLSKNDPDTIYNLNEYKQIITKSCYPHPQK